MEGIKSEAIKDNSIIASGHSINLRARYYLRLNGEIDTPCRKFGC